MALQTTLATRFWLKTLVMAVVCIVLGVWGIWDYAVVIPQAQTGAERGTILRDVLKPAMDTTPVGSTERTEAIVLLQVSVENVDDTDTEWKTAVSTFIQALEGGDASGYEPVFQEEIKKYGDIVAPSKFDRPMQWLFILCLPFGFYYLWSYSNMKKRAATYLLDDVGTLTTPEGCWTAQKIKDIDMERWISKTGKARTTWTAKVIVEDHKPILLDDYVYKDIHLIIGSLAHRFYPEDWTPLAKRVKKEVVTSEELPKNAKTSEEH
ncbi:MAG: hypothetical protein H8E83_04925 [Planctomycetes bacterium]|nr:hypothetical protein [Planctomycetota bacterium]